MKVLVIGGAGYIGSHVARELLDAGHRVSVFDNLSTGAAENIFPEESFFRGDILRPADLEAAMAGGFDALVHLAAAKAAGESMTNPEKYSIQNLSGTINILNAACAAGIRNIVFSSSAATYGEPAYLPIDEKHPTNPENYYGFTKLEIERILAWYDRLKGLKFAALRYFNAAGYDARGRIPGLEKNPANLIPVIMEVASGMRAEIGIFGTDFPTPDGSGLRDYVHVSDLARAHAAALEKISSGTPSFIVNLGSENGISVLEILAAARRITGKTIPAKILGRRPGDPAKLVASSALAREILGWKVLESDVDTLVKTTWEAYRKHTDRS
jgi:UDP-glucose 4-epimerase